MVGETEVDSKHDRSMICNGQLKGWREPQAEEGASDSSWSAAPVREMGILTPQPQDLNSTTTRM